MIDTKKVRLMTKISMYESGQGKEDLRMYKWKQGTYVSMKVLESLIYITISFALIACIYAVRYLSAIMKDGMSVIKMIGLRIAIVYGILMALSWLILHFYYKKRYRMARKRVVRYDKDLYNLEVYLKEEKETKNDYNESLKKKEEVETL
ncbi:MAG: hypothetical protein Q4E53_01180 [Eubacteriales bacterium]|nr:hypothetical protein [Eubacteriales bacterium]